MVAGPRIAALLATSEPDEIPPWFATEYVQGLTLSEYVAERGPLPVTMAAALGIMLAEGLNDIHTAGLLHRDLKPGNVILGADGPRVIDFGLAGLIDGAGDITHTSGMVGTPVCMAPEQAKSPKDLTDRRRRLRAGRGAHVRDDRALPLRAAHRHRAAARHRRPRYRP